MRTPKPHPVYADSRYRYSKRRWRLLFSLVDAVGESVFRDSRLRGSSSGVCAPRSILVVQLDHVGDAVLTTPMLAALRRRFPDAAIDVLGSAWNHEVFRGNPSVRQVHVSRRNWQARDPAARSYLPAAIALGRHMRRFRYDLGIDPRGDFLVVLALWLAGIPRRLGWACGGGGFLLTDVASWQPVRHELESRAALLEAIGIPAGAGMPELFPSWADRYAVRELLASSVAARSPLIVVHLGAGTAAKRWPLSHWAALVDRLVRELSGSVVLVGGAPGLDRARQLARSNERVSDWVGRLSLLQLAALLEESDLFIGGDSGPAHVAAAMGVPSVVLFSGTNRPECWRPVGGTVRTLRRPVPCSPCHLRECPVPGHPCMSDIRPAEAFEVARELLSEEFVQDHRRRSRRLEVA